MTAAFDNELGAGVYDVPPAVPLCEECRQRPAKHIDAGKWRCRECWTVERQEIEAERLKEPWMRNGE